MLPKSRADEAFIVPKFDLKLEDIEDLDDELRGFQEVFHDCFVRSESRENLFQYTAGQIGTSGRKSIEPMALTVSGGNVRSMQRFISDTIWEDDKIDFMFRSLVAEDLGDPSGALIFDESSFVKKGDHSAGVTRQYCGTIGKVENCQVGVFAAYATKQGYSLVDRELYIPQKWFGESYSKKRKKCKFPDDVEFETKPQLAAKMLRRIKEENVIPFRYVLADSVYGENPDFISEVEKYSDLVFFVGVGGDTSFWLHPPKTVIKEYRKKGKIFSKETIPRSEKKPTKAREFAESLHDTFWYRRKVSEGTKGPIEYEFTKKRVTLSKGGFPGKSVWLIIRRTMGENKRYSYFLSNAPTQNTLPSFVWLTGIRWAIEQCFEEAKSELGMDHYEVRKYTGWRHHMTLTMLAHFFLWHLKIRWGKKSTIAYGISD